MDNSYFFLVNYCLQQLNQFVTSHTANFWASSLVKGLLDTQKSSWGTAFALDFSRVKVEYDNSRKRALFLDYDVRDIYTKVSVYLKNTYWFVRGLWSPVIQMMPNLRKKQ